MFKLIVLSNRTAATQETHSGGVSIALLSSLKEKGGLWLGWNGKITPKNVPEIKLEKNNNITFATTSLTPNEYDGFYLGYSNSLLWPIFHNRPDIAIFNSSHRFFFDKVNKRISKHAIEFIAKDNVIWVHDYQLMTCGEVLRSFGIKNKIGFFLHIPFPPSSIIKIIPDHKWLISSLLHYDLIGFQSCSDKKHFLNYIENELNVKKIKCDLYEYKGRLIKIDVFPIGIDTKEICDFARDTKTQKFKLISNKDHKENFIIGVDRLDYTKGISQRIDAMRYLFLHIPNTQRKVTLVQIAEPSRENIIAYKELRRKIDRMVGEINGDYGDEHWTPVKYIRRHMDREQLSKLYSSSSVGLVTTLIDGMNLVAKEYIAAQDPEDPGVLILSILAGAANQLKDAILINPYDIASIANAIHVALLMPQEERKSRHAALLKSVVKYDVHWWFNAFLSELTKYR